MLVSQSWPVALGTTCAVRRSGLGQASSTRRSAERYGPSAIIGMHHLTHIEKQKLEEVLRMSGGYVLDFSDPTIAEFFRECVGGDL
jgi:hypothetical protein